MVTVSAPTFGRGNLTVGYPPSICQIYSGEIWPNLSGAGTGYSGLPFAAGFFLPSPA
jgi:hypothetical protein